MSIGPSLLAQLFNKVCHFRDIIYSTAHDSPQLLVPLASPFQTSIQFWVEPFEERCKNDLRSVPISISQVFTPKTNCIARIDFAYSQNDQPNKFGCTICANTIYGTQFGNSKRRHRVSIEGSSIAVHEDEIKVENEHQSVSTCPVRLRHWELDEENREQF